MPIVPISEHSRPQLDQGRLHSRDQPLLYPIAIRPAEAQSRVVAAASSIFNSSNDSTVTRYKAEVLFSSVTFEYNALPRLTEDRVIRAWITL
jgi:hypothetical protein